MCDCKCNIERNLPTEITPGFQSPKTLDSREWIEDVQVNEPVDLQRYGNYTGFVCIAKAVSKSEGWMKSTKALQMPSGVVIQMTTQQRNPDGSYAVAETSTYVPGVYIAVDSSGIVSFKT